MGFSYLPYLHMIDKLILHVSVLQEFTGDSATGDGDVIYTEGRDRGHEAQLLGKTRKGDDKVPISSEVSSVKVYNFTF